MSHSRKARLRGRSAAVKLLCSAPLGRARSRAWRTNAGWSGGRRADRPGACGVAGTGERAMATVRGEGALGLSREKHLPVAWSATENVAWAAEIAGHGWSSPVVWGDTVYVTAAISPGAFKAPTPGIYGNDYIAELRAQGLSTAEINARVRARDNELPATRPGRGALDALRPGCATGQKRFEVLVHRGRPIGGRHRRTPMPRKPRPRTASGSTSSWATSGSSPTPRGPAPVVAAARAAALVPRLRHRQLARGPRRTGAGPPR
jgi:hypothetical protein